MVSPNQREANGMWIGADRVTTEVRMLKHTTATPNGFWVSKTQRLFIVFLFQ